MKKLTDFILAVLAGAAIAIGGTAFLSLENKIAGSLFFCIGLFMVCTMGLQLFTGKVCALPGQSPAYLGWLAMVWAGNLIGAELIALCIRATRLGPALVEKSAALCAVKTEDSLPSLFLLGILCNILIYVAVESYRNAPHFLGKYLGLIFGVSVFILCGFEHCVADMYYFALANWWSGRTVLCLLSITLGNGVGGILLPLCFRLRDQARATIP